MPCSIEVKKRYWKKKKENAPIIECACGCGEKLKAVDNYGRPVSYINGHNRVIYQGKKRSASASNARWLKKNPEWRKAYQTNYRKKRKLKFMEMFGNKCNHCGLTYNGFNAAAFEFHHQDPAKKDFGIASMIATSSYEKILIELEKCILICANCHNIHHNGRW